MKVLIALKWRLKLSTLLQYGLKVYKLSWSFYKYYYKSIAGKLLCKLTLGPDEGESSAIHWKKMVERPEEHIYSSHWVEAVLNE